MYHNCKPPSLMTGLASDSGEVSTLFSQLLHSPSSSCMPLKTHQHRQDLSALPLVSSPLEYLTADAPSGGSDVAVAESSSSFNFSDPSAYISADVKGSGGNPNPIFSGGIEDSDANTSVRGYRISTSSDDNHAALACNMEDKETSELPSKPMLRSSSKRSRTAEVHNLSEKRRRSRINEKMKALQNLIPNSNKTDKASMLDEAIEYLKQLQLQVQMLSLRKGLSLHPMSFTGIVQPIDMPQEGISCADGNGFQNASGGFATLATHVENSVEAAFNLSKEFVFSSQPVITKETTTAASKSSSSLHPPFRVHDIQMGHFLPTSSQ